MRLVSKRISYFVAFLSIVGLFAPLASSSADQNPTLGQVRTVSQTTEDALGSLARLTVSPITLSGGGKLTLISPELWNNLGDTLTESLKQIHVQLTTLLGPIPAFTTSVRLIDQETFSKNTGAPKWTNALFYRGQIMIPLALHEQPDLENLDRAVRHEYTHAVVNALSGGKCPGWLDEGLAQWIEGTENPALRPALFKWLKRNSPVPLSLMQGGFTRLESEMVPAAYAQSLFSATVVINTFGFDNMRTYFDELREGQGKETAFHHGFGISLESFENRLGRTLKKWEGHQEEDALIQ